MDKAIVFTVIYTFLAFFMMAIAVIVFIYYSRKKILKTQLQQKNLEIEYQKKVLESTIRSQEKERSRIARDIHDAVSSRLNVISLNAQLIKNNSTTEPEKNELLDTIISQSKDVVLNTRRIAHNLLPPVLEQFGLKAALEELCYDFNSTRVVQVHLKWEPGFELASAEDQLHLFRIIQELLSNSLKHGKATIIQMEFARKAEKNTCLYTDNGTGFSTAAIERKTGLGMKNIESRTKMMNGTMSLKSTDKGISVNFEF